LSNPPVGSRMHPALSGTTTRCGRRDGVFGSRRLRQGTAVAGGGAAAIIGTTAVTRASGQSEAFRSTPIGRPTGRAVKRDGNSKPFARYTCRCSERICIENDRISVTPQLASGSGRICTLKTFGRTPVPPSLWKLARVPDVVQRARPFQPAFGSSMRPSTFLLKNPSG
jgi:hypothetical protein